VANGSVTHKAVAQAHGFQWREPINPAAGTAPQR
jgi:hypothetical protein